MTCSTCSNQSHKAKVSWEDVCYPKEEGGLGIRKLQDSGKVFALRLIWRMYTQPLSLWACWRKHYPLKYSSFWDVRDDTKGSWIWRKLLKSHPLAYSFLRCEIKDGTSTHFWFDNWMNRGRLIDITGVVGTTYLGVTRQSKVSEAANQDGWRIRGARICRLQALYTGVISLNPPHTSLGCDIMLWKHGEDDFRDNFSSSTTWNQIRKKKDREQWSRVVWFAQGVPRYGFITWLAMKHRLSTGDRMRQWGAVQGCEMCGERDETRDHLFFACSYSYTVWEALVNRILGQGINPGSSWTVQYLIGTHHRLESVLAKMFFQTTIYHIWRERNARRHHQIPTTADQMKRRVDKAMRTRIISLKYPFHHKLAGLLQRWFLHTM